MSNQDDSDDKPMSFIDNIKNAWVFYLAAIIVIPCACIIFCCGNKCAQLCCDHSSPKYDPPSDQMETEIEMEMNASPPSQFYINTQPVHIPQKVCVQKNKAGIPFGNASS